MHRFGTHCIDQRIMNSFFCFLFHLLSVLLTTMLTTAVVISQEIVEIQDHHINEYGQIEIEIEASDDQYYILFAKHSVNEEPFPVSMSLGQSGNLLLTEGLAALPIENYIVREYSISDPGDLDGDGINDAREFLEPDLRAPFNPARPINFNNGTLSIPSKSIFQELSYQGSRVLIDTHLRDLEFVKFYILDAQSDFPKVYFLNTVTHRAHFQFADAVGIPSFLDGPVFGQMRGEIVYHPFVDDPTGRPGVYRFEFEPNDNYKFEDVRKAYELLAAHMPFLRNNWTYYPMPNAALPRYLREKTLYDNSRIQILLEEDLFFDISYIPFNLTASYGLLRVMDLNERPNARDIVIYESLPNELPRVGGIMTTVPQTPLSHVNLRAIQDGVPNAYVRGAVDIDEISRLIGKYVYYEVGPSDFKIREVNIDEVEAFYDDIRPEDEQAPIRDLAFTSITALDEISFDQSVAFGVKTANLATMRKFGFPKVTIPNGYGIPFYFYDEFMKHNDFYTQAEEMMAETDFQSDTDVKEQRLKDFRKDIRAGELPGWMYEALSEMQNSFPEGSSIRCRSSSNNEDLPGFVGAGLYSSKTQHPDEGHIEKSVKQVYASMWNFRAFDERQFYRIDHLKSAMGVLCHLNFSDELANGVGVTLDPINQLSNAFYLNTQVGEDLVTNPDALSIPEEILMDAQSNMGSFFRVIRYSNLKDDDELIMERQDLAELQRYMRVIHDEFKILYEAEEDDDFAMEIEYKITDQGALSIKQARPWASFWASLNTTTASKEISLTDTENISLSIFPNPIGSAPELQLTLPDRAEIRFSIFQADGRNMMDSSTIRADKGHNEFYLNHYTQGFNRLAAGYYYCRFEINMGKEYLVYTLPLSKVY